MRARTLIVLVTLAAAAITFLQWFCVIPSDNFDGILVQTGSYKVFRYGFPFQIVVTAAPGLSTPEWQTPWRVGGNFVTFVILGLVVIWIVRFIRKNASGEKKVIAAAS